MCYFTNYFTSSTLNVDILYDAAGVCHGRLATNVQGTPFPLYAHNRKVEEGEFQNLI